MAFFLSQYSPTKSLLELLFPGPLDQQPGCGMRATRCWIQAPNDRLGFQSIAAKWSFEKALTRFVVSCTQICTSMYTLIHVVFSL